MSRAIVDGKLVESESESLTVDVFESVKNANSNGNLTMNFQKPTPAFVYIGNNIGNNLRASGWYAIYVKKCTIAGDIICNPPSIFPLTTVYMDHFTAQNFKGQTIRCKIEILSDETMDHAIGMHNFYVNYFHHIMQSK